MQPFGPQQQHDRLQVHARVAPLRGPHCLVEVAEHDDRCGTEAGAHADLGPDDRPALHDRPAGGCDCPGLRRPAAELPAHELERERRQLKEDEEFLEKSPEYGEFLKGWSDNVSRGVLTLVAYLHEVSPHQNLYVEVLL